MKLSLATLASIFFSITLAADAAAEEAIDLEILLNDIQSNIAQYETFLVENQSFSFPIALIGLFTQITTYTDDSYTTLLSEVSIDPNYFATAITALPWYSTRLLPEIAAANAAATTAAATSVSSIASSSSSVTASPSTTPVVSSIPEVASSTSSVESFSAETSSAIVVSSSSSSSAPPAVVTETSEAGANNLNLDYVTIGFASFGCAIAALLI